MLSQYAVIAVLFLGAVFFTSIAILLSRIFQPRKQSPQKKDTYECGFSTIDTSWFNYKASFFLYAIVFLIFEVEVVFLYPWAVQFQELGLIAIIEMIIFFGILIVAFIFAWREGAFKWN